MPSKTDKPSAKYNLRNKKYHKKSPPPESSSSSDDDTYYSDEETVYSTASDTSGTQDESAGERTRPSSPHKKFNRKDFQNILAQMFPSKYMDSKTGKSTAESSPKSKHNKQESFSKSASSSRRPKDERQSKENRQSKERRLSDSEQSDIDIANSESDESTDYDEEEETSKKSSKKGENINIILTIGKKGGKSTQGSLENGEDEFDDDFDDDDSYEESDDESQCNSEDEKAFMKEAYEEVDPSFNLLTLPNTEHLEPTLNNKPNANKKETKSSKHPKTNKQNEKEKENNKKEEGLSFDVNKEMPNTLPEDIESEYLELLDLKKRLSAELAKRPTNKILKRSVQECTDSIRELIKQARRTNTRKYRKLIYEDTKPINEMEYFKRKLSHKEQRQAMEDLNEIYSHIYTEKPYRLSLIQSKMPSKFKAIAMQKLNVLKMMDPSDSEYYKIKNWVDTFMKIPFGIYKSVSVSIHDGVENCNRFLVNAKQTLDDCTYGLNDAKMQIMQMLGQWMVNPVSVGSAIAIHGPMGTGKTTLVKEGISKILGREFTFIALGGGGDASFLEGHSYTYEGSTWGKIVQILIDSKCMNPVIYFDELDKVSDTPRGQEIIGILTHLIDTSQNTQYHDKYFSEIDFDLSKCLFIFSYNDENLVNPILRDRMYHIRTKGYEAKDKVVIARNYLLPKIREQVCFSETDVIIPDEMIQYIVSSFTKSEMGVRNLKRCLEIIYSKLNLFRLVSADNKMFTKDMNLSVSFPITITKKEIDVFVKTDDVVSQSMLAMYV
jgi:ATP-dependent Lon protease